MFNVHVTLLITEVIEITAHVPLNPYIELK